MGKKRTEKKESLNTARSHLLVNLDDSNGVGARVRHNGRAESDYGIARQLAHCRILLGDLLLEEVVRHKPAPTGGKK